MKRAALFVPCQSDSNMKQFALYALLLILLGTVASAQNTLATAKCRALHHVDAGSDSVYSNSNCLLRCDIRGQVHFHNMKEGEPCPQSSAGVCRSGQCVKKTKLGFVDVEIGSATLSQTVTSYANVCIQNGTASVSLPIADRSQCVTCTSNLSQRTSHPRWNQVCADSNRHWFLPESRVTVEIWESKGTGAHNKVFLGGVSLSVDQLTNRGDSGRELTLALTGGSSHGNLKTRITWTPI